MMINIAALDSATKYPSIETYHALDPQNGRLLESVTKFRGDAVITEKIDGANGRIVFMPGGDYFIGSRDALLYAQSDRIINPALGIVSMLRPLAEQMNILAERVDLLDYEEILVWFFEVYGGKNGGNAKQYTSNSSSWGARLFDVATVPLEALSGSREQIASWREHGGQGWISEDDLQEISDTFHTPLTPRLDIIPGEALPSSLEDTYLWLKGILPRTLAQLDDQAGGRPEGVVIRSCDRSVIAKARFQNYERTLTSQPRQGHHSS